MSYQAFGQLSDSSTLTVSTYNVLNLGVRDFTSRHIDCGHVISASYAQLVVLQDVVDSVRLKSISESTDLACAPIPFLSKTNNALLYDTTKIAYIDETVVPIGEHFASQWRLIVRSSGDTIAVLGCQLSQGNDSASVVHRNTEAQAIRYHMHTTSLSKYMIVGTLNVNSSDDLAYRWLVDEFPRGDSILRGQTFDPAQSPGVWHDNQDFARYHTASTRIVIEKDSGSGGGMMDRHDFILLSKSLFDSSYAPGTYRVRFNKGNSYRDSIRAQDPKDFFLAWAQNASDHLPVLLDLVMRRTVSSVEMPASLPKEMDLSQKHPTGLGANTFEDVMHSQPFRILPSSPTQFVP